MVKTVRRLGALYLLLAGIFVATVLGCVLYAERDAILVHYHVRRAMASEEEGGASEAWLRERTFLALPALLSRLAADDPATCGRASAVVG